MRLHFFNVFFILLLKLFGSEASDDEVTLKFLQRLKSVL
jgi:hypothetical protein